MLTPGSCELTQCTEKSRGATGWLHRERQSSLRDLTTVHGLSGVSCESSPVPVLESRESLHFFSISRAKLCRFCSL